MKSFSATYIFFLLGLICSCSDKSKPKVVNSDVILETKTESKLEHNDFVKETIKYIVEKDTLVIYKSDTITIQSLKRISNTWKGANGGIKVSLKEKTDTLFDGSYGLVPDYKIIPSDYGLRLFTRAKHNGGGNNDETWCIVDLNYDSFMDSIYSERINVSTERRGDSSYWFHCSKELSFSNDNKQFIIQLDSVCTKVDESKDYKTYTLSEGIRSKKVKLK